MIPDRLTATDDGQQDGGTPSFRVLAACAIFEPGFRGGGTVRSVAGIVDTVSAHTGVTLVTSDRDLGCRDPYPGLSGRWVDRNGARVFYLDTGRLRQWLPLLRHLREVPFDLLYLNSLWSPAFTVIPILAVRLGLIRVGRVLLAPRGELSAGALSLKGRKKRLFLASWSRLLRSMDVVWHASTDREAAEIRAACPWANIEVNMDQVALPREPIPATAHEGPPRLVFISRVAAVKNLELVLASLRTLSQPVEFDVYGPLEDRAYWARCQELIAELPPAVHVRYRGELAPTEVCRTFSGYDAFVFPTLGENFGHVIAESLSAACPVICSENTPWTEILATGGGRVVRDLSAESLGTELEHIVAMPPAERLRARHAAGDAYRSWRHGTRYTNVLDHARTAAWSGPPMTQGHR